MFVTYPKMSASNLHYIISRKLNITYLYLIKIIYTQTLQFPKPRASSATDVKETSILLHKTLHDFPTMLIVKKNIMTTDQADHNGKQTMVHVLDRVHATPPTKL